MAKFSPVCPIHIYEKLQQLENDTGIRFMGNYFLLLAHDVVANASRYEKVFKDKGYTIIMDNSVIELGDACNASVLHDAVNIVGANVLAIPDVLENGKATIKRGESFLGEWESMCKDVNPELMFIPQGDSIEDYKSCFNMAYNNWKVPEWIGIARNTTTRICNSREELLSYMYGSFAQPPKFHLLGFSRDIADDIVVAKFANVEGIDSAVPLRVPYKINSLFEKPSARGNWWDDCKFDQLMAYNILATRKLIGESIGI